MSSLTSDERTCLNWCNYLNRDKVGFLGPTVLRKGPQATYESAVAKGLVTCVERGSVGAAYGYWITEKGKKALADDRRPPPTKGDAW